MIENLQAHIQNLDVVKLDIGCGPSKMPGYIGVDLKAIEGVDFVINLDQERLPIPDGSVDTIYCAHFLEHVDNPSKILEEFARVLKHNGTVQIKVPHYTNPYSYHFTHKTYWSSYALQQEYLDYYATNKLLLTSKRVRIVLFPFVDTVLTKLANLNLSLYERFWSTFVKAWEIEFTLTKDEHRLDSIKIT